MSDLFFPCPACRERASVARRWTGATEVDTFDDKLGGWTEHHYADTCARCGWSRSGVTRTEHATWLQHRTRDDRLFYTGKDEMLVGSLVADLRIRAELPDDSPAGERLARVIGRGAPLTFETEAGAYRRALSPVDVARGAVSLARQLAQTDTARAVIGAGPTILAITTHGDRRVARLLVDNAEQWIAPANVVLAAIAEIWRTMGDDQELLARIAEGARAPGAQPLTLIALHGDHPVLRLEPRPSISLGRSADNDVVLQHKIVSRHQSVLSARGDGWYVRDAESTSGTYVERERVVGERALCLGDRLDLGALAMLVC